MSLTHLSLFSGIGGLDLAAELAGIKTVAQCEWADYPTKVLEKHWPDVPRWKDIKTLTGESFYERTGRRTVDIISGGFPCQPFSVAGKQRGKEDDRYLWPEMVRVIKELRPTWIVGENVAGIVRMALPDILSELEACGYRTRTFLIPACAVGARHRRYRVAIVGYSEHNGLSSTEIAGGTQKTGGREQKRKKEASESERTGKPGNSEVMADTDTERELQPAGDQQDVRNGTGISGENVANTKGQHERGLSVGEKKKKPGFIIGCKNVGHTYGAGLQTERTKQQTTRASRESEIMANTSNRSRAVRGNGKFPTVEKAYGAGRNIGGRTPEHESREWRSAESRLGRVVDGIPCGMDGDLDFIINHYWDNEPGIPRIATGIEHRVDRLKCLGNAVVPQQFYPIFKAIAEVENLYHGKK